MTAAGSGEPGGSIAREPSEQRDAPATSEGQTTRTGAYPNGPRDHGEASPDHRDSRGTTGSRDRQEPSENRESRAAPHEQAEQRESSQHNERSAEHKTIAHFEPTPPIEGARQNKPYVVWSSSPTEKATPGDSGPEE